MSFHLQFKAQPTEWGRLIRDLCIPPRNKTRRRYRLLPSLMSRRLPSPSVGRGRGGERGKGQ